MLQDTSGNRNGSQDIGNFNAIDGIVPNVTDRYCNVGVGNCQRIGRLPSDNANRTDESVEWHFGIALQQAI